MQLIVVKPICSPLHSQWWPCRLGWLGELKLPDPAPSLSLPGVGKTTLIQKASEVLQSSGMPVDGFYTQEVRQGGRRIGFDVVTLSGARGPLSRVGYCCFVSSGVLSLACTVHTLGAVLLCVSVHACEACVCAEARGAHWCPGLSLSALVPRDRASHTWASKSQKSPASPPAVLGLQACMAMSSGFYRCCGFELAASILAC